MDRTPGPALPAALAATVAFLAASPGFAFPFLSDDWGLFDSVAGGFRTTTIYADFRPLFMASWWIESRLWGLRPAPFHVTNAVLIAAAAALVVLLAARLTRDRVLAGWTGVLFALHPYHVENAAWIAARTDVLAAVLVLLAALSFLRWRETARGVPVVALLWFAAALLAKETAIVLPALLAALSLGGGTSRDARPDGNRARREWLAGLLPMAALAAAHFVVLRPAVLGGTGRLILGGGPAAWTKNGLGLAAGTLLPLDVARLAERPALWGASAAAGVLVLAASAAVRSPGRLRTALAAAVALVLSVGPHAVGFEERYAFLASAAGAALLASLALSHGGRTATVLLTLLAAGWLVATVEQWGLWNRAAVASRALVAGLVETAREPDVREIVVANAPFRVGGGSVLGDLSAATALSGGRAVPVRAAASVSTATADRPRSGKDLVIETDTRDTPGGPLVVHLRIPDGPFDAFVGPPSATAAVREARHGPVRVLVEDAERSRVRVEIERAPGRAIRIWADGTLRSD